MVKIERENIDRIRLTHNSSILWVIGILLILVLASVLVINNANKKVVGECSQDSDCVKDACCHASGCVPINQAPNCSGMACTLECKPNTLDCGGRCLCQNNQCKGLR